MKNIFSLEQQQQQLSVGKKHFLNGNYREAEPILQLVAQSTLQHNDYDTYVEVQVLLNRLYINTSQYEKLNRSLIQLNAYIPKYGDIESHYFFRLQTIIFNRYYSIGQQLEAYEQLYAELKETAQVQLLFITGSNLTLEYIETGAFAQAKALYNELSLYAEKYHFENKMLLYIHEIYVFIANYCLEDYDSCRETLTKIENNRRYHIIDSFAYMYDICRALYIGATGSILEAKAIMDATLEQLSSLEHIRFELKLWINLLKKHNSKDNVIYYQNILLEALEQQYTHEISDIRRQSIEERTKQFYEAQMYIDQLTDVRNRNFYEDLLAKQQKVKNYCVAVLDIDRFKSINDTYGHLVGDEAIQFLAKALKNAATKHDIEIIRYGGDEFILLIPYAFERVKDRIYTMHHTILTTPFISKKDQLTIPLSISIGIAYTNEQYATIHELFEVADLAIYEAKKTRSTIIENALTDIS